MMPRSLVMLLVLPMTNTCYDGDDDVYDDQYAVADDADDADDDDDDDRYVGTVIAA